MQLLSFVPYVPQEAGQQTLLVEHEVQNLGAVPVLSQYCTSVNRDISPRMGLAWLQKPVKEIQHSRMVQAIMRKALVLLGNICL